MYWQFWIFVKVCKSGAEYSVPLFVYMWVLICIGSAGAKMYPSHNNS